MSFIHVDCAANKRYKPSQPKYELSSKYDFTRLKHETEYLGPVGWSSMYTAGGKYSGSDSVIDFFFFFLLWARERS